jgi:HEAT repeat protein
VVTEAWQDSSQEDREIIADTLFRLDCDRAVDFLYNALIELDPWSRVHIIDQLGTMPTRRALDCIARFVDDENEMVQESARSALRAAGFPFAIDQPINKNELLDNGVNSRV